MDQLAPYVVLDISVVIGITLLSLRFLTFFHPLLYYLLFHVYAMSSRSWELLDGRYPMYFRQQTVSYYSAIRPEEFIRGLLVADAALVLFFIGCLLAKSRPTRPRIAAPFNDGLLKQVIFVLLPISFGLLLIRRLGSDASVDTLSGFALLKVMGVWPIALVTLAIARWGMRWHLVMIALIYLGLVATQGYHRFQAFLPLLLLLGVYLARRNKRWPGIFAAVVLLGAAIAFPGAKQFGRDFQAGGVTLAISNVGEVQRAVDNRFNSRSEMFLDQYAGALTAADGANLVLFGRSYYALLTLPIPRALWPEKPSLGTASLSVTAAGRPYDKEGRIVTVIGESYINFRYFGIFVVMILLGFGLTRYYLLAFSVGPLDPYKVAYIGVLGSYFQVFRDGLPSLILFSVIAMAPLYIYLLLNSFLLRAQITAQQRNAFAR